MKNAAVLPVLVTCVCLAVLLVGFSRESETAVYNDSKSTSPLCGISAVCNICALWDIDTNMSEIYRFTGIEPKGVSLFSCKLALENMGLGCRALSGLNTEELPSRTPVLALVRGVSGSHAVALIKNHHNECLIMDGNDLYIASQKTFDSVFQGIALITSRP